MSRPIKFMAYDPRAFIWNEIKRIENHSVLKQPLSYTQSYGCALVLFAAAAAVLLLLRLLPLP